jgi:hypothetical protein
VVVNLVREILAVLVVGVALGVVLLAPVAMIVRHARWERDRRRREAIPMTDDLVRACRFYDDQWDPRGPRG